MCTSYFSLQSLLYDGSCCSVLASLWEHQVDLNWFWQTELWSVATLFEVWKEKRKNLQVFSIIYFLSWLAHKLSILYLRFFCVFKEDCMFGFITCMFACFFQLFCLLPSLASQKPVLRGNSSRASTPLNQNLCHLCPPYLPSSIIAIPSKFLFYLPPKLNLLCEN